MLTAFQNYEEAFENFKKVNHIKGMSISMKKAAEVTCTEKQDESSIREKEKF